MRYFLATIDNTWHVILSTSFDISHCYINVTLLCFVWFRDLGMNGIGTLHKDTFRALVELEELYVSPKYNADIMVGLEKRLYLQ